MIEYKHFSAQFSVCADGSFKDTEDLRTSFDTIEFLAQKLFRISLSIEKYTIIDSQSQDAEITYFIEFT